MKEIHRCLIFFPSRKESTRPLLSIRIRFANYDIITDLLSMPFCAEHFINMKYRILATFNIIKKINSDSLCAFKCRGDLILHFYNRNTTIN